MDSVQTWQKHYDYSKAEAFWRKKWDEWKIHEWNPNRPKEETFVVDTPPPTVSGQLHIGHLFSYTHQDIIVRQQRMRGKNIYYPIGWDDNGLATERRVRNYFNIRCDPNMPYEGKDFYPPKGKNPAPPVTVSRKKFIELCSEVTANDEKEYEMVFRQLGLSLDWSQGYETINEHARRIAQLGFLRLLEKERIYSKQDPIMWDVGFQTAVSQAEVEDRIIEGAFHDIIFQLKTGESVVISTTRPELLPACIALVAHPEDSRYRNFFGMSAITPLFEMNVPIIASEIADPDKGTGIMMVCTFGDSADVSFWREHDLPLRSIISMEGRMKFIRFGDDQWKSANPVRAQKAYDKISGKTMNEARREIVNMLLEPGSAHDGGVALLGPPLPCEHPVNFYEKGEFPLEFIPTRQWFIRILDLKEELITAARKINWHPVGMRKRLENWIEGLNYDWCISRQRYFGVPIPVWYPIDSKGVVLYDEPLTCSSNELPVDPLSDLPPGFEAGHRDQPEGFTGESDILDTWATSSLTPYLSSFWELDPARHRRLFPADIRPQAHDIIRTWAFYTIVMAHLHEKKPPWHNIVISGWILDPDRKKLSKSKDNARSPQEYFEHHGTDVVRYWAGLARLGVDTMIDETVFRIGRRLTTKIYNAAKFTISLISQVDPELLQPCSVSEDIDRDMIRLLSKMTKEATKAFASFEFSRALEITETFFWKNFCDFYIELIKKRAYNRETGAGSISALATLKISLSVILRCFAPFLPVITEEIWSRYYAAIEKVSSIHVAPWPLPEELSEYPLPSLPGCFNASMEIMSHIRGVKTRAGKKMGAPVSLLTIKANSQDLDLIKPVIPDIKNALIVESIRFLEGAKPKDSIYDVKVEF